MPAASLFCFQQGNWRNFIRHCLDFATNLQKIGGFPVQTTVQDGIVSKINLERAFVF